MDLDPSAEARFFARLAMKGVLEKQQVEQLFAAARAAAEARTPTTLHALAAARGLIDPARFAQLLATDGDSVPELSGFAYERKLGEGGTACVYAVRRLRDDALLALKLLHERLGGDARAVAAFVAEAQLLQRLEHEHIVKGYKAGRLAGRYLCLMELAPGRSLQEAISAGEAFDEAAALTIVLGVARALEYLRGKGIVHRDIKPGNILWDEESGSLKVIDLGFAGRAGDEAPEGTTRGTAAYLSPEQARGQADLDVRSDIYALGATLYQLVLGELPFTGDDEELVQKAVLEGLSAAATKGGRIAAPLHFILEKMMAKDRGIRFQDPAELMEALQARLAELQEQDSRPGDEDDERIRRRRLERMRRKRKLK